MGEYPHIYLGDAGEGKHTHSLPCYPQSWSRIVKRLGRLFDGFTTGEGDLDTAALVQSLQLSGKLYEAFVTFVPRLPEFMQEHEFNGFASPVAWKEDRYEEAEDHAPTFPQFLRAFDTIIEVNGGKDFMEKLGKVFPPEWIRTKLAEWVEDYQETQKLRSDGSQNSLGTNGESPQKSSTTTPRTPAVSSGSSGIESLDFVPRSQWMPEPSGQPLASSA